MNSTGKKIGSNTKLTTDNIKIHCHYDELKDPHSLVTNRFNQNNHPKDQIKRLAKILEYQGWRYPIKISNQSGQITTGHGRVLASLLKKWKEVPVVYQDYDSIDQEIADVHADNAIAAWASLDLSGINNDIKDLGPDFDLEMLGIKDFQLDPSDKYADKDADAIPESRKTDIKLGDLFILGNHRLLCGDATKKEDVDRLMNGEKADMVYTDPPYGMSVVKKDGRNNGLGESIDGVVGVAARGRYRPVIGDDSLDVIEKAVPTIMELADVQVLWGANFYASFLDNNSAWIFWDKENGDGFFADGELAWTNCDKQLRMFKHQWKGMIRDSERGEKRVHPTQKPVALAEWVFDKYGNPKSVVDVFLGSGSTLIACEKTNRRCFGMEIDPQYCQVIIDRWEQFTGKKAVKHG